MPNECQTQTPTRARMRGWLCSLTLVFAPACIAPTERADTGKAAAIARVLEADAAAASIRDHASESVPLADAVLGYVVALDGLDLSGTPAEFRAALREHRDAWAATIPWMRSVAAERGEMHEVLGRVRLRDPDRYAALEPLLAAVFSTWGRVERAAR